MTKVAVTGASGFIGRHVLAALLNTDVDVVAHARLPRPEHEALDNCHWAYFDLVEAPKDAFDRLGRPDVLIHLAWAGLPNYLSERHFNNELPIQSQFLRSMVAAGLSTLVVSGSCLEYGMRAGCLSEAMQPMPSNLYEIAKDTLRREIQMLCGTRPLALRWLRLFYLYGDGQSATSLYSQFRAAVAHRDRRFDMSAGEQVRDFMKVEEAASAVVSVALAKNAPGIVNICSGRPISVRAIVERWRAEMASDIELNLGALPYPRYEPFAFWGDNQRLSELLGAVNTA